MFRLFKIVSFSFVLIAFAAYSNGQVQSFSSSSVLSSGKWFKVAVTADGIYRIDYSRLRQLGLEFPSNPRIFGNNCGQLSYYNNKTAPDDLKEIAIYIFTGSDGIFNEGDYLLFYARGTSRWIKDDSGSNFSFVRHNYSDTAFYFLTSGNTSGKRVVNAETVNSPAVNYSSVSDALYIYENENENLLHSGREWYQPLGSSGGITIDPSFTSLAVSDTLYYKLRVLARASVPTSFLLSENNITLRNIPVTGVDISSTTGIYAQAGTVEGKIIPSSEKPVFKLTFSNGGEISARGWIDYLTLQGRKNNRFDGQTEFYSDSRSVGNGIVTEFTINTTVTNTTVWDVTDQFSPQNINYSVSAGKINFRTVNDSLRTFAAFTASEAIIPEINTVPVTSQDLHSSALTDMIIVAHKLFIPYATKLAALHLQNNSLSSLVVTPEQIYNEFSGGIPDIVAIRNFVRMRYLSQKETTHPLKYLLLFGDGSYNNKLQPPENPNYIPTYQSQNSNVIISSFTSDDFYGLLDEGEGEDIGTEDIGIGRIPVSDTTEAGIVLSKIEKYINSSSDGDWKNFVCLTADDEDGNTHISDAEGLASIISENAPWINISKIYFDAFTQETGATGQFYPDVTRAINDRINEGCLIFNYIGHGNESSLGHERVVTPETIDNWTNINRLPLFITATCEFSRFDDISTNITTGVSISKNSSGENILTDDKGGAIALMSTTRLVYSAPNYTLNRNIFNVAFGRDDDGKALCLGDIIRIAKNRSGSNTNKRNFVLLGDPALQLSWPWQGNVVTDSINNIPAEVFADTLKALATVTVSGHIENIGGKSINDFEGVVEPIVFGKQSVLQTLANDGGQKFTFSMYDNILYSGKTSADNGKFRFTFIVPRDIDYSFGNGKISYYASGGDKEVTGVYEPLPVGGFSNTGEYDNDGPTIRLFLNDTLFRNGGITDTNPLLYAIIEDKNGINIAGTGIGHDVTCTIDNNIDNQYVLNNYFENDFGEYKKGTISYRLTGLTPGVHYLTVKAWDNYNNSNEESLSFNVNDDSGFILRNLVNFPNPFNTSTRITAEHNRPDEMFYIRIEIFSITGSLIKVIKSSYISTGYRLLPVEWDGSGENGKKAGRGLYPYRLTITTGIGETATLSGRMIIY